MRGGYGAGWGCFLLAGCGGCGLDVRLAADVMRGLGIRLGEGMSGELGVKFRGRVMRGWNEKELFVLVIGCKVLHKAVGKRLTFNRWFMCLR